MIYPILLASAGLASHAWAACTRESLQAATASYVKAVAAGDLSIAGLSANVTYMENDVETDITTGVLSEPVTVDLSRSLHDTTQCATFTEISAATNAHPYVIHTRMMFTEDEITSIESVIADAGDWAFDAAGQLRWSQQEAWEEIPEAERDARDVIQAAGDLYLDSWSDGTVEVPYGTPCARLEGGSYTDTTGGSRGNTCYMPVFPEQFTIGHRRYVIDEVVGGLDIFNDFPFIDTDKPDGTPSTNLVRVEGGKIRYIHEVTVCTRANCGR
ncbi:hypothetical protein GGR52DRAFT_342296 [Hypoxylon sp. FL1284]|nr:hypothetical protein GGR52DRAFT_342296 [Hypoxylon sp. FL1284]